MCSVKGRFSQPILAKIDATPNPGDSLEVQLLKEEVTVLRHKLQSQDAILENFEQFKRLLKESQKIET